MNRENDSAENEPEMETFSLEALNRAYARAVAEQNGESAPADENVSDENASPSVDLANVIGTDQKLDDEADNAGCEISPHSILEAMLFVGSPEDQPLKAKQLAALMRGVSPKEIRQIAKELNAKYETEQAAFRISSKDGHFRMTLDPSLEFVRQKFYGEVREATLSQVAIDVLSIVAYNQPVTREQIEQVRGKSVSPILLQLQRRGLLEKVKTTEKPRKTVFNTTPKFLELFGLEDLSELPQTADSEFDD